MLLTSRESKVWWEELQAWRERVPMSWEETKISLGRHKCSLVNLKKCNHPLWKMLEKLQHPQRELGLWSKLCFLVEDQPKAKTLRALSSLISFYSGKLLPKRKVWIWVNLSITLSLRVILELSTRWCLWDISLRTVQSLSSRFPWLMLMDLGELTHKWKEKRLQPKLVRRERNKI